MGFLKVFSIAFILVLTAFAIGVDASTLAVGNASAGMHGMDGAVKDQIKDVRQAGKAEIKQLRKDAKTDVKNATANLRRRKTVLKQAVRAKRAEVKQKIKDLKETAKRARQASKAVRKALNSTKSSKADSATGSQVGNNG